MTDETKRSFFTLAARLTGVTLFPSILSSWTVGKIPCLNLGIAKVVQDLIKENHKYSESRFNVADRL